MKKTFFCVMLLVVTTSTNVYAWGFQLDASDFLWASIGVQAPGIGASFLGGYIGGNVVDDLKRAGYERDYGTVSFAPAVQLDLMIGWLIFGIETGVGYTRQSLIYVKEENNVEYEYRFLREEITIPLMFRLELPLFLSDSYSEAMIYASVGVKFGIPLNSNYVTQFANGKEQGLGENANNNSDSTLDVAFAIGYEVFLEDGHFVGLRLGYDINVVNPGEPQKIANIFGGTARGYDDDFRNDNLNFSLTYRYIFLIADIFW